MILGIMNNRNLLGSLFMLIGGIFAILPVLPLKMNIFPIFSYTVEAFGYHPTSFSFSFWFGFLKSKFVSELYPDPSGWTPLGISPLILILAFACFGSFGIILSFNTFFRFFSSNDVRNNQITSLGGIFTGLMILLFDLLIFYGDALSFSKAGLQFLPPKEPGVSYYNMVIGLGYWLLVLSGILLLSGSLINLITFDISKKAHSQQQDAQNIPSVNTSSSPHINQLLEEIDAIIQDTTDSEKQN